ncbi:TrpR like protein, YerC/YecD [Gottschalkia acidurici 9a]|uniref:TrpR like protein, YerC/YecD n=1 Tax=Gottschalkia acidurici (strain ATCC 7906 / DSM 604 / BCRC 14475 / CIP 104303 / KCTC 5404 / NCIMB 10678 / 9a) TaxID=1128398 RepID=K0AU76_GOTA9|nr:YerC/YecD family TrpR-related protein [Gottschalkia acidurici]AFS77383.1 TrpR like protein, YerC/YecD [Gottschalkia acidurici 9a]
MEHHSKIKDEYIDELFEGILKLKNIDDCYRFFEDVCTIKEIKSISQRLQVAKLLKLEKTYNDIEEKTGASTATISRVNRVLNYGAEGYDMVLDRLGYSKHKDKD